LRPSKGDKADEFSYQDLDSKYVLLFIHDSDSNQFGVTYFDLHTLEF